MPSKQAQSGSQVQGKGKAGQKRKAVDRELLAAAHSQRLGGLVKEEPGLEVSQRAPTLCLDITGSSDEEQERAGPPAPGPGWPHQARDSG